jgi:hypothetical protein
MFAKAWPFEQGDSRRGHGDNLDIVNALSQFTGLRKVVLGGFYARTWPAILKRSITAVIEETHIGGDESWKGLPSWSTEILEKQRHIMRRESVWLQQRHEEWHRV